MLLHFRDDRQGDGRRSAPADIEARRAMQAAGEAHCRLRQFVKQALTAIWWTEQAEIRNS